MDPNQTEFLLSDIHPDGSSTRDRYGFRGRLGLHQAAKPETCSEKLVLKPTHLALDIEAKTREERKVEGVHFPWEVVTNELESLFEVLPEVLFVAVGGRQPLVVEQAFLVMVEGQVRGDVDDVADIQPLHGVQVLSVLLVAKEQEGQDGRQLRVLDVGGGGDGLR